MTNSKITTKIQMDKILQEIVEEAYEWGSKSSGEPTNFSGRDLVFAEVLADLEIDGDAMRYVDAKGRIAWKATPDLRDYLEDLRLDALADFEQENV